MPPLLSFKKGHEMKLFPRLMTLLIALVAIPALAAQNDIANIGTKAAQPASGTVKMALKGPGLSGLDQVGLYRLDITLTNARITVTDAAGSGSSGSLKLLDFNQYAILVTGCRQDYTAFAEGSALTTAAGDAAFKMGLGTVAADAGDGALTSTEVDFCAITGTITDSAGTGAGTLMAMGGTAGTALDGTGTAKSMYLNWSGTAATIDANSTIDVTGTISISFILLGDD